jgi:hypothetical protein
MLRAPTTNVIRSVGYNILKQHSDTKKLNLKQNDIVEWIKCRNNPLYYIYNYVKFEIVGGVSSYKDTTRGFSNFHSKYKQLVRVLYYHHLAELMATRQLGKSTIAGSFISWATTFFPGNNSIILNLRKDAALKNLKTIRFINDELPYFLKTDLKSKSDIKTYAEFSNGSKCSVYYPTTVHTKSTIARSLTAPILYIDEAAHIQDMKDIFGAAQPILSKAREQAAKNNYPYIILVTTTPNGVSGTGEWFYDRWENGIDADLLFDDDNKWVDNRDHILKDPSKNGFVKIRYHWAEDPSKNEAWYIKQCQELSDQRLINQELDLIFVGSTNCIFDDELLNQFKSSRHSELVNCPHETKLKVFQEKLNPNDYYLIGVDTARSLTGAYNSVEVFSFLHFNQIAEFNYRLGSFTKYGEIIDFIFKWLRNKINNDNIIVGIENNTIGLAPIEHLLNHVKDINYHNFLYIAKGSKEYGISTTGVSKDLIIGCLIENFKENPKGIKSQDLINQISSIERTRGGNIASTSFSDLFMAASFCAYVRKMKAIDILPIIKVGAEQYQNQLVETYRSLLTTEADYNLEDGNVLSTNYDDEIDKLIDFKTKSKLSQREIDLVDYILPF